MTEKLNDDGLFAGQTVDYETMTRINLERKANAEQKANAGQANTDKSKTKNTATTTRKKKA